MDNAFEEVIRLGGLETEIDYPYDGKGEAVSLFNPHAVGIWNFK